MADIRERVFKILQTSLTKPGQRNLVEAYIASLERSLGQAKEDATTDQLTGLDMRKTFETNFKRMILRSLRIQYSKIEDGQKKTILSCISRDWEYPVGLVMIDIDHFKKVNDNYGHQKGDAVLKFFAQFLLKEMKRETDAVGRYGGEEFVLGLENVAYTDVQRIIDDMRRKMSSKPLVEEIPVTFSAGICSSEFNPEIALLYSKSITPMLLDFIRDNAVSKEIKKLGKRLNREPDEVLKWFEYLKDLAIEYIDLGYKGQITDLLTFERSKLACYLFEERADKALYHAKQTGRNKVSIWTPEGYIDTIAF